MTDKPDTIETMCRFCLCSDDLIPFSEAIHSAFDFEDVVHFTGIVLAKDEMVVVCEECCISINNSKNFRLTCMRNDNVFKRLVCFDEYSAKTNITDTCDDSKDAEREIIHRTLSEQPKQESTDVVSSENRIRLMDESDSDNPSSVAGEPVADGPKDVDSCNVIEEPAGIKHDRPNACEQAEIEKEDDIDSYYSMFLCALYGDAMQEALNDESSQESSNNEGSQESLNEEGSQESSNDKAVQESLKAKLINESKTEKSTKQSTENNEERQTTGHTLINRNSGSSTNWSKRIRPDANDSDDSVASLYSEWKDKIHSEHGILPIDYGFCNPFRSEQGDKRIHYKSYTINKSVELCSYCGLMTKYLTSHVQRTHCVKKKLECPHCLKKFPGKFDLKAHINTRHERKIILTCDQCGKGFVCRNSYDYHMANSHGKSDVYECETCHRKLKSWDGYRKHLKEHSLTALKCEDCGKLYKKLAKLEQHKLRHHPS